jgi:hypothetical protein
MNGVDAFCLEYHSAAHKVRPALLGARLYRFLVILGKVRLRLETEAQQIEVLGTKVPSPDNLGARGGVAPVEELKVINVARAPTRFRALPDDTRIAFKRDKPVASIGPILKLFDGHVIAGLAAGTAREECARDIDHVR